MTRRRLPLAEFGVASASIASVLILGAMLASPFVPQPTPVPLPTPPPPTPSPSHEAVSLPIGLYLARNPLSRGRADVCVAIELGPESYAELGGQGPAMVLLWGRGRTGCDARNGEVTTVDATVEGVVAADGASTGEVVGYTVAFSQSVGPDAPLVPTEIAILLPANAGRPLQALEVSSPGAGGVVLDLIGGVPEADPSPSP